MRMLRALLSFANTLRCLFGLPSKNTCFTYVSNYLPAVEKELVKADIQVSDPSAWAIAINDLRLALAVRLDIEQSSYEKYELMPRTVIRKNLYMQSTFWLRWTAGADD